MTRSKNDLSRLTLIQKSSLSVLVDTESKIDDRQPAGNPAAEPGKLCPVEKQAAAVGRMIQEENLTESNFKQKAVELESSSSLT